MKNQSPKSLSIALKGIFTKVAVAAVLAGTVLFAAPRQANAQGFSIQFGRPYARPYYGPVYAPPVYARPVYAPPIDGPGFYAERRRDEWLRHDRWEHDRGFHGRPPAYGFYGR